MTFPADLVRRAWSPGLCLLVRCAARELKAADAGLPACCAGILARECVVLIHIPERAVVSGIDIHGRVVAPSRVSPKFLGLR